MARKLTGRPFRKAFSMQAERKPPILFGGLYFETQPRGRHLPYCGRPVLLQQLLALLRRGDAFGRKVVCLGEATYQRKFGWKTSVMRTVETAESCKERKQSRNPKKKYKEGDRQGRDSVVGAAYCVWRDCEGTSVSGAAFCIKWSQDS